MIRRGAAVIAAYVVLTVVASWPYTNYREFGTATYGGDYRLIAWTLGWDNHALLSNLPLFESNIYFPAHDSLRYNEHLFGVSLFTLPLAALGAPPVLAHNVVRSLAWLLNGLATFLLLRRFVRDTLPAFVGSLAFVCTFYVMLHAHSHLHLLWLWPMPLSMWLLERWFDRPTVLRLTAWVAVFLLGALTSWYLAVMMLTVNGVSGVMIVLFKGGQSAAQTARGTGAGQAFRPATRGHDGLWPRRFMHLLCAVVVVGLAVYPFARHYVGMKGGPGEAQANSATLASYLVPPHNTLMGLALQASIDNRPGPIWGETTLFAGWIALTLAFVGLVSIPFRRDVSNRAWMFVVLAVVGFLLSLGPSPGLLGGSQFAPFAWMTALPGFEGLRAPARFAAVATLGLAGLSAFGAAALMRVIPQRRRWLVALLAPLMLAEWFVVGFPAGKPTPYPVPAIYQTAEVRSARALVSLPEYWATNDWVLGGDYLYYSMWHWRPIVNGFGRTEPPGYASLVANVRDFPHHAPELRAIGLQYVVVHADRFPNHGREILDAVAACGGCRLVRQVGSDYLFELVGG